MEFDWQGITKENKPVKGKTIHIWYVVDNPNEGFSKILKADVSQVKPSGVLE